MEEKLEQITIDFKECLKENKILKTDINAL